MIKNKMNNFLKKFNLNKNEYYLIVGRLIPDNNSKLIKGFLKSKSKKKLLLLEMFLIKIVMLKTVKKSSNNIIFTGYIKFSKKTKSIYIKIVLDIFMVMNLEEQIQQ